MLEKKKLRDIAESISGIRPSERSLEGIVSFIEEKANIVYEKQPRTFLGRLRELGYALNGVRPTQRSLRGIVNNIYENYEGGGGGSAKIYGVSGLSDSAKGLTRTDDAVDMNYTINLDGTITSDFDDVFPFNEMVRETIGENVFVKVPSMWFRVGTDNDKNITDIAVSNKKGKGKNWYETKEFYYGAYLGNVASTKMYSQSGVKSTYGKILYAYSNPAKNIGTNYDIADITQRMILNFLFLIEFANKDSQTIFSLEKSSQQTTFTNGELDSFESPTAMTTYRMKWRNIEDFVGQLIEFVISPFYYKNDNIYAGVNYTPNPNITNMSVTVQTLGWDSNCPFICFPKNIGENFDDTSYFGNGVSLYSGVNQNTNWIAIGEAFNSRGKYEGAFRFYMIGQSSQDSYMPGSVGARLVYSPNGV